VETGSREARASAAFIALTDTLVADFDLVDLLHVLIDACTDLLETDAGGLLLIDGRGDLRLMASSVEDLDVVEVVQLSASAGPCFDCFRTGEPVSVGDIEQDGASWPDFQRLAVRQGYRSVHATPMRLRGQVIGSLNLFSRKVGVLPREDVALAQSLTDVATIAILQERGTRRLEDVGRQLQGALESRVVVEQAKGLVAESLGVDLDRAFTLLRQHARSTNQNLHDVATAVTQRRIVLTAGPDGAVSSRG
jgi:GAF domain-containing protein